MAPSLTFYYLVWQIVGCGVAMALSGLVTVIALFILKFTLGLQVSENTEDHGLDQKYHVEEAYNLGEQMVELEESSTTTTPSNSGTSPTFNATTSQDLLLSNKVQSPSDPRHSVSKPHATKQVSHVESSAEQSEEPSSSQQQSISQQQSSSNQSSEEASDSSDS